MHCTYTKIKINSSHILKIKLPYLCTYFCIFITFKSVPYLLVFKYECYRFNQWRLVGCEKRGAQKCYNTDQKHFRF